MPVAPQPKGEGAPVPVAPQPKGEPTARPQPSRAQSPTPKPASPSGSSDTPWTPFAPTPADRSCRRDADCHRVAVKCSCRLHALNSAGLQRFKANGSRPGRCARRVRCAARPSNASCISGVCELTSHEPSAAAPKSRAGGARLVDGSPFDAEQVDRTVKRRMRAFQHCRKRAPRQVAERTGELTVGLTIQPRGNVTSVELMADSIGDQGIADCVTRTFQRFRFSSGPKDGWSRFHYRLAFGPLPAER